MTKDQFTVNQAQVAYLLGVTTRTVQAWGKRQSDPLPAAERTIRGQAKTYDPQVAVRWYLRNELAKLGSNGEVLDLNAERARLAKQQADKIEMENRRLRGELVPVVVVRRYLEKILAAFRSRVLAIPSKLAPLVVGIKTTPEARDVIENHLHDALHELSRLDVSRFGEELKHDV